MRSWTPRWVVVTTPIVLGCGGDPPPASLGASGTWITESAYEIGSRHGERASFGRISDVRLGIEGQRVYVVDRSESEVTAWTPGGALLLSVGGEGEGPGEFRSFPRAIHVTQRGLQVLDRNHFVEFSSDGRHLATTPIPSSVSYRGFGFRPGLRLEDGSLLVYPGVESGYRSGWWGDDPVNELPIVRLSEQDGRWGVDSLTVLDVGNEILGTGDPENLELTMFTLQPYRDSDQVVYNARSETVVTVRMKGLEPG